MSTAEAKPMLRVARAENTQGYKDSIVLKCSFCKQQVWVSKPAVELVNDYVLGCDKCFPARIERGPKTP